MTIASSMQESLGTLNWIGLLILGGALHWTLYLVYGTRRSRSDDMLLLVLSIVAWLLVIVGVLGPMLATSGFLSVLVFVGFVVVAFYVVTKYRESERRALLWALAVAADRGLSLALAARAFATGRSDEIGRRALRLADLIEAGLPLPDALRRSRNPLPTDADLSARLGFETGEFAGALKEAAREGSRFMPVWEPLFQRMAYLVVLVLFAISVVSFVMWRIVPIYGFIFADFDTELPAITQLVVSLSEMVVDYFYLVVPLLAPAAAAVFYGLLFVIGWVRWEPPGIRWFTCRHHGAIVMRYLAMGVEQGQPLADTVGLLADCYPRRHIGDRLRSVAADVDAGGEWCEGLRKAGLIGRADAAVLRAAQRVGNLPWALREMSDSAMRRLAQRLGVVLHVGIPLAVLAIGVSIGVFVLAMFLPLVTLIQQLS